jgi:hypothetical protein
LPIEQLPFIGQLLRASDQIALKHHAHDAPAPTSDLFGHSPAYSRLFRVILPAVRVTAINHDSWRQARYLQ